MESFLGGVVLLGSETGRKNLNLERENRILTCSELMFIADEEEFG